MSNATPTARRFWKSRPAPMWRDLRALSLLVPAIAATLGGIAYSIQGIAVTQSGVLPQAWIDFSVSSGAVLLAIGCEGGTLAAMAEIARKRRDGDAGPVDAWAGWVSFAATVFSRLLALTALRSLWAIVALVILSAADVYALISEAGEYLALADRNMERWLTARFWYESRGDLHAAMAALRGDAVMPSQAVAIIEEARAESTRIEKPITLEEWRQIYPRLNGSRPKTVAQLRAWCESEGYAVPSESTARRWVQEARQ